MAHAPLSVAFECSNLHTTSCPNRSSGIVAPTSVETVGGSPTTELSAPSKKRTTPIRVLLIGPSLDILGGQAVQATRLMSVLGQLAQLNMTFFPINPRPPSGLGW